MKAMQIKLAAAACAVALGAYPACAYLKSGGAGGNMDDPAFWGVDAVDPSQNFGFIYPSTGILSIGADYTHVTLQAHTYFKGEFNFSGKTLRTTSEVLADADAQVRFTGGTWITPKVRLQASNGDGNKWKGPTFVVDGADAVVEGKAWIVCGAWQYGADGATIAISNGTWRGAIWLGDAHPEYGHNVIRVAGANSRFEHSGDGYIGVGADDNRFEVVDGATFTSTSGFLFGYDRGWNKGGGDGNVFMADNAKVEVKGDVYTYGSNSNRIEILNGTQAEFTSVTIGKRSHYLGGRTLGNAARIAGAGTHVRLSGDILLGYDYADANELVVEDGAELYATNTTSGIRVGNSEGHCNGNRLVVRSGAYVCGMVRFGHGKANSENVGNEVEIENGTIDATVYVNGHGDMPAFVFNNASDGKMLFKGTNSSVRCSYFIAPPLVRFEIPDAGLAAARATQPLLFVTHVSRQVSRVEVDVAKRCPKGKWLLYAWKGAASGTATAEEVAANVVVSGAGAERAHILAEGNNVYLKMDHPSGTTLLVR